MSAEEFDVVGFRYRGQIVVRDPGTDTSVVRSCPMCGALVMDDQTPTHDAWHEELTTQLHTLFDA